MLTVINGFNEALELAYGAAVDHEDESHSDGVLHTGQAVVQLANRLDLARQTWDKHTKQTRDKTGRF